MIDFRRVLPYLISLISLLVSFGWVHYEKTAQLEKVPSPIPSATPLPQPEPFPRAARWARCQGVSEPRFFFYTPPAPAAPGQRLTLSGMVYASNLTPLPNALIEISEGNPNSLSSPPSHNLIRTDKFGHYEFTFIVPTRLKQLYLHYLVTYKNYCPLLLSLQVIDAPLEQAKPIYTQAEVVGPVLHGPVDIVLPALPPKP